MEINNHNFDVVDIANQIEGESFSVLDDAWIFTFSPNKYDNFTDETASMLNFMKSKFNNKKEGVYN